MASEVSIYACDDATKAATAKALLLGQGYQESNIILLEQADTCIYNATLYDGGKADTTYGKIVVIARKP